MGGSAAPPCPALLWRAAGPTLSCSRLNSNHPGRTVGRPQRGSTMPRFYFDKRLDDEPWSEDTVGGPLAGPDKARTEALEIIREVARDHLHHRTRIAVRVRDNEPV